ncbi:DUF6636 domain-containing protein [Xylanimonas ulmi]|uniref:DUF6636 domain-containing protein n=1 Tax=Xylanimonas ulmi TaxID=228973 RepID=UPI00102CA11E|nr:DUF6636 domain-containing protein [Xylanibacterium ulmi]
MTTPTPEATSRPPSNDDIPTAPFTPVPPAPAAATPVPPPPATSPATPAPASTASPSATAPAPVRRVSAVRRMARPDGPTSPFAASAPQPARPMPGRGIPLQQVSAPAAADDWFTATAAQQAQAPERAPWSPAQTPPTAAQTPQTAAPASYAPPQSAPTSYPPSSYPPGYEPAQLAQSAEYAPAAYDQVAGQPQAAPAGAGEATAPRRRVSAGWVVSIVLAVVLVALGGMFAWSLLQGSSPDAGADGAATGASEEPSDAASDDAADAGPALATFASPTGNITCEISADAATCSIAQLAQQPAPSDTCDGTVGNRVSVTAQGAILTPCVPTAQQPQPAPADMSKLDYGQSVTQGQFTCTSERTGMQCRDDKTGKGFSLARAGIGTY